MAQIFKYSIALLFTLTCTAPPQESSNGNPTEIKLNWMNNIKSTARISSNHYSDFVVDKNGNSYISCFYVEDGEDYIYLVKISRSGEIVWEKNTKNKGRATAIAIDGNDNIWVTGFFKNYLDFGGKTATDFGDGSLYLAKFNADGECLKLITSGGGAIGYNIHINNRGDIIVTGSRADQMQLGSHELKIAAGQSEEYFMAILDPDGKCKSLQFFPLNISKIKSDQEGNFILAGRFNNAFEFKRIKENTKDGFDYDAFIMKLDPVGELLWFKKHGKFGNEKYGYRSPEGFDDLVVENNGDITVIGVSELEYNQNGMESFENKKSTKSIAITFNKNGEIIKEKTIATHDNESSIHTISKTLNDEYFVTFTANKNSLIENTVLSIEGNPRCVLLKYNSNWELLDLKYPVSETDALFRIAKPHELSIFYSGHFRGMIDFMGNKIENDGKHSLFMVHVQ